MTRAKKGNRPHAEASPHPFSTLSPVVQDLLCILLLYAVTLVLFRGIIFDNAAFASEGDTAAALSYVHAGTALTQAEGVDILWMPYFFSGMPTFGNVAFVPHNVSYIQTIVQTVLNFLYFNGTWTWLVVYYFLGGVAMFFLMRAWKFSRVAALIAALTFMLSPYAIGLAGEGHGSKLMALSYLPLAMLFTHLVFERRDLLSFGLLAATIGTLMLTDHMQIVYYVFMLMGFYLLVEVVSEFRDKPGIAATRVLLFALALALGFCISSYIYLAVYEYAQFSMRGGGTIGSTGGLAYDYATNWSWHPGEIVTLLIPGFYGMKVDYYWGPMIPWTNSSVYVGILPILYAPVALLFRKSRLIAFMGLSAALIIILSFGRNLPLIYELLFNSLPFFDKFRAPVMILHLLPFTTGVLAGAGYSALLGSRAKDSQVNREKTARFFLITGTVIGGTLLLALVLRDGLFDMLSNAMFLKNGELEQFRQQYGAQASRAVAQVRQIRFEIFWKDYVKFALITSALCALTYAWLKEKIREWTYGAALIVVVTLDLSLVSSKYIDPKPSQGLEQSFRPDATVAFLKGQQGLFRIFAGIIPSDPLYIDNTFAYHGLQSITGYSPAKLKIYQTMLDSCMYRGADRDFPLNMGIVDMLNVEFLVAHGRLPEPRFELVHTDPSKRILTYRNPTALPRAFWAQAAVTAKSDAEVFQMLNSRGFDATKIAVLYETLPTTIESVDSTHIPQITDYKSQEITLKTDASVPALLVLSEIYYPAGWKAYIDGAETKIYRTDYVLRSVCVPAGTHTVVFKFNPPLYHLGWVITNAAWGLALVCVLVGLFRNPAFRGLYHRESPESGTVRADE